MINFGMHIAVCLLSVVLPCVVACMGRNDAAQAVGACRDTLSAGGTGVCAAVPPAACADTAYFELDGCAGDVMVVLWPDTLRLTFGDTLNVRMRSYLDKAVITGDKYGIERWNGKGWDVVDLSVTKDGILRTFDDIGCELGFGDELTKVFRLYHKDTYEYESGKYRIRFYFTVSGGRPVEESFAMGFYVK